MKNRLSENLKPNWHWWVALTLFDAGDMLTTCIGITFFGMSEGNPLLSTSVLTPWYVVFKLILFPALVIPFLALVLPKGIFPHLIRMLTFVFLEVMVYNIAGMIFKPEAAEPYTYLEMIGLISIFLYVALSLTALSERIETFMQKRGRNPQLANLIGGV